MKKMIFIILCMVFAVPCIADNMCIKTGSFVSVLSKSRDGISHELVPSEHKWIVQMDYIVCTQNTSTISGFGACSETPGTASVADSTVDPSLDGTGTHCWCKLNSPLVSDWVYYGSFDDNSGCASNCLENCASNVQSNVTFRSAMLESIW